MVLSIFLGCVIIMFIVAIIGLWMILDHNATNFDETETVTIQQYGTFLGGMFAIFSTFIAGGFGVLWKYRIPHGDDDGRSTD
jgi:hypothetical protein